ncbi:MAG: adenylosuccinate lyase family protein [Dehalococcoidia bacterium]|nr:adenylosuccinate lyase [Dehalococcoidia bacterium]MCD5400220.1 adenylosuccinate lyase family protein [Dehalococcoidia bacterium]
MQREPAALRMADPGVRAQFTEEARFQSWLDVEAALAQAQADLEVIPRPAADEITRKARLSFLDINAIHEGLAKTGHPLVPLIWELDRVCDGDSGGWAHWGATTQNITQTGKLLTLREAHRIYLSQLAQILTVLANLAEETKDYPLPGRTHGQHAVPATFGYKVAVWIDELCRHVERLQGCEDRVFVAMLGGGAGTLASLGEVGLEIQDLMALKLDMKPMTMPARTTGDHLCEYVTLLGMLASTCSKIGGEVFTLMKQEFGEVEEPVPPGTVGSSTMPQKRNPKLAQDIVAVAAQIRALVPLALEAMITEHEANRTTSVMMNRALDQSAVLTGDLLQYVIELFSGIQVFPERMRANLDLSGGLIMSEAIMLELGLKLGRQRAHDAVYDAAQASVVESRPFKDTLAEVSDVASNMTPQEIEVLLDPTKYTGICSLFAQREAAKAREVAASLNS